MNTEQRLPEAHRTQPAGVSRRDVVTATLASAAAALFAADADGVVAAEQAVGGKVSRYDQIEPQKFPWGWIRWVMNDQLDPATEMTVGLVQVEAHQSNPPHVHPNSAEILHMLSGTCEHRLGDQWFALKKGDTLRIPRGVPHCARTQDEPFLAMILYDTGHRQMVVVKE